MYKQRVTARIAHPLSFASATHFFVCINIEMLSYAKHVLIANFRSFYLYSSFFSSIESSWSCEIEKWEKEMVRARRKESRRNVTCKLMYIFLLEYIMYLIENLFEHIHCLVGLFCFFFLFWQNICFCRCV